MRRLYLFPFETLVKFAPAIQHSFDADHLFHNTVNDDVGGCDQLARACHSSDSPQLRVNRKTFSGLYKHLEHIGGGCRVFPRDEVIYCNEVLRCRLGPAHSHLFLGDFLASVVA